MASWGRSTFATSRVCPVSLSSVQQQIRDSSIALRKSIVEADCPRRYPPSRVHFHSPLKLLFESITTAVRFDAGSVHACGESQVALPVLCSLLEDRRLVERTLPQGGVPGMQLTTLCGNATGKETKLQVPAASLQMSEGS